MMRGTVREVRSVACEQPKRYEQLTCTLWRTMDLRIDNPCDRVAAVLGPQQVVVEHMQALTHQQVAAAVEWRRMHMLPRTAPQG